MNAKLASSFARLTDVSPSNLVGSPWLIRDRLSRLYELAQRSDHVFGSPLGPSRSPALHVPRFVYFGPNTSDASVRLAFLAGFDHSAPQGTLALIDFVQRLATRPELGHGLNLSFFPAIDVLGLQDSSGPRALVGEHWGRPESPEIALLAQDARLRSYQGFVHVTSTDDETITVRISDGSPTTAEASGVELIDSDVFEPLPVRFEATDGHTALARGPLSIADDLLHGPFELTLSLPAGWPQEQADAATASILRSFIVRFRADQAYGQHL